VEMKFDLTQERGGALLVALRNATLFTWRVRQGWVLAGPCKEVDEVYLRLASSIGTARAEEVRDHGRENATGTRT